MQAPPATMARLAEAAAGGPATLKRLGAALPRVTALLDATERLLRRVEGLVTRLEQCEWQIRDLIDRVSSSETAARTVIENVTGTQQRAAGLLDAYEPPLRDSIKTVTYLGERFGPAQVDALVAYLEFLPLLEAIDEQVVPTMSAMRTVAPDLTELVAVSRGLNDLMGSLPGLGRAKKRVDEELDRGSRSE